MPYLANTVRRIWEDRFKRYSLLLLLVLGVVLIILPAGDQVARTSGQDLLPVATMVELPLLGVIDARDYSLPALAAILGLVDGLNPCAMWVLVYLISLILATKDQRKVWLLVGSFVLASGILYFLFMTAWLNAFLFIGYMRPLTLAIGLFALWVGLGNLYEWLKARGVPACEIVDPASKQQTLSRLRRLVMAPLSWASLLAMIGLAFVVNSIEFLCSAAIPAVFTHMLSLRPLSALHYYSLLLLYDFFFMLDDMVIFGAAAFAARSAMGERYARFSKPVAGLVMLTLGILMVFFPDALR